MIGRIKFGAIADYLVRSLTGLLIMSLLVTINFASAQSDSAIIEPDPLELGVGAGQVERACLVLEGAKDVYGIDVRAKFDPNLVEVEDVDMGKEGVQMIPGEFIKPDFLVRNIVDNQNGTLQYVITQVNPTPPASGKGIILCIHFRGKALGESPFAIEFVNIADRTGNKLPVQGENGKIHVVPAKPPTPTPTLDTTPTAVTSQTENPQPEVIMATNDTPTQPAVTTTPDGKRSENNISPIALLWIAGGGFLSAAGVLSLAALINQGRRPSRSKP